jgi:hypothetical protein
MNHPFDICATPFQFRHETGYVWPTPEQQWMLRAALLPGQAGLEAWEKWKSLADIDHLDHGSFRMIPLLYRNLKRSGGESEMLGRFKGIYRRAWYENQMALYGLSKILAFLHKAGIPTLILKGAALALLHYRDLGLRPMADVDVLVPVDKAIDAMKLLRESGWKPEKNLPCHPTPEYLLAIKACNMVRDTTDIKLDLHWHVFQECLEPDADIDLWKRSVTVTCGDSQSHALSPPDQLLHICAHAMEWNAIAPMRWVADAMTVLSTTPDLDWNLVLRQIRKRHLVLTMQYMLPYLRNLVDAPIPEHVLTELQSLSVTTMERDWASIRTRGISHLTVRDLLRVRYELYRRSAFSTRFRPTIGGFPRYMQFVWGIDHWWNVPARGIRIIANNWQSRFARNSRNKSVRTVPGDY